MEATLNIDLLLMGCLTIASASNFNKNFVITWGQGKAKTLSNGRQLALSLDSTPGSAFMSENRYLYAKVDMQIKLVPDNSAGTLTTLYMTSMGPNHDEIDFEFLGNRTGHPYTMHTNVYSQGKGNREQQFRLWFDPTKDFHTYSIAWTPQNIIFSIDDTPIRVSKNMESIGVPYPKSQPMRIHRSLWNADDWATQGGRAKTDWSKAPFTATYGSYTIQGCKWSRGMSACPTESPIATSGRSNNTHGWMSHELDSTSHRWLKWVRANHTIYNYCNDKKMFPQGLPLECNAH